MSADDVVEVLRQLEDAGVTAWVDGGWGVDALVGEQTRPHEDLDLALDRLQLVGARRALEDGGFHVDDGAEPGLPARLVLRDQHERAVDLHPLAFDDAGDGWQQLSESGKAWGRYPADGLRAEGAIAGRPVRCLSASLQARFRLGYEWTAKDEHDVALLVARFGVPAPPALRGAWRAPPATPD
jgi:lincosamide nucleotidyltransferase A/C/D/E